MDLGRARPESAAEEEGEALADLEDEWGLDRDDRRIARTGRERGSLGGRLVEPEGDRVDRARLELDRRDDRAGVGVAGERGSREEGEEDEDHPDASSHGRHLRDQSLSWGVTIRRER